MLQKPRFASGSAGDDCGMSEPIESLQALFEHQLKTMLWVERKLSDEVLPGLRHLVHSPELKADIERHLEETRRHVNNVERVFGLINVKPQAAESEALKGLRNDHDEGLKLLAESDESLVDAFDAGAIARAEHLEIAAYNELTALAEELGEETVAIALKENLEQEEHGLHKAEQEQRKLLREKA
jgi:ferritin-like metal-binding protein YciE